MADNISSGVISTGITLYYYSMCIFSGGVANSTTLNLYGYMRISSGGVANSTTVNSGGDMYIEDGGVANSTTVNSGGYMRISSGGTATNINWTPCVGAVWANGAYVTYTSQYSGVYFGSANQLLSHTTSMSGKVVSGTMYVMDGGVANSTTVNSSGYMRISSGGVANSTTVNDGGDMYIEDGGVANSTTVNSGGDMYIEDGGVANSTTVYKGDMYIYDGGVANSTTVDVGSMYISSGGAANNTTVNSSGHMDIYGGVANSTTVNSGGRMYIEDGGVANSTTVNNGSMYIYSGGTATAITAQSGARLGITVASDTYIQGTYNGSAFEMKDAFISGYTVNYDGDMDIRSGGVANGTTVNWGYMYISSGGVANSTTVNSSGYMRISSGGVANSTTVNSGWMRIFSGGVANSTTVYSKGSMSISSGGVANSTTMSGGYMVIYGGGVANSTTMSGGYMDIYGGVANSTTVYSKGSMYISSGGVANSTTVNSGGAMYISSGGTATAITAQSGARLDITVASDTYIQGTYNGSAFEMKDAFISGYTVNDGGWMYISSGGVANSTTVNSGGSMYIYDGGLANGTTVNSGGAMYISSGGTANDIIANGGAMYLYGGCEGNVIITNSNSLIYEDSADKNVNFVIAENCRVSNDVFKKLYSDEDYYFSENYNPNKILTDLSVKGTFFLKYVEIFGHGDGGYYVDLRFYQWRDSTVCNGGIAYIGEYTEAENITIEAGGNLYVAMSGIADSITIDGGAVHVATGGMISDVTISNNGKLFLYGGAILDGVINVNGTMVLDDLAVNKGKINLVLNEEANKTAMINNLAFLGGGDYSVSVDNAGTGEYLLAAQANDFDSSITIQNSDGELGSLQLGETIEYNNMSYSLTNNNGNLALQVTSSGDTPDIPDTPDVPDEPAKLAPETVDWSAVGSGNTEYVVKYTTNEGSLAWDLKTFDNKIDTYGAPAGKFDIYTTEDELVAENKTVAGSANTQKSQQIVSNEDGSMDLFFGNAKDTWKYGYSALHTGIKTGWAGTGEKISLAGKNKIADIFEGSSDANVLVLTDDSNGDALFVDDVFTALPDSLTEPQARFAQIDEIRAGNGDDIVDMTSQRFEYVGDGVKIYGGLGNDTIWANNGENTLFGDAGNDRIVGGSGDDVIVGGIGNDRLHGGCGVDTFCFGGDWGKDSVEQLPDGEVILWFESGSIANWNKDTLTYTDGKNTVKVTGVSNDNITLIFGDDGSARYDELAESGCFEDSTSEKIFEDKNKGYLA